MENTQNGRNTSFDDPSRFNSSPKDSPLGKGVAGMMNQTANFGDDNFDEDHAPSEEADYFDLKDKRPHKSS